MGRSRQSSVPDDQNDLAMEKLFLLKIREGCNTIAFVELCQPCMVWERLEMLAVQQTERKGRKFDMTHYKELFHSSSTDYREPGGRGPYGYRDVKGVRRGAPGVL